MACGDVSVVPGVSDRVDAARERNDGPAIWTVTDFDSTLYLYGTVHLLPSDLDWQKDDMRAAFKEAGTVFFEVDTGTDGQIQAAVLTTSLGMRSDGLRLSDRLDSYQLKLLDAAAHNGDITLAALDSSHLFGNDRRSNPRFSRSRRGFANAPADRNSRGI